MRLLTFETFDQSDEKTWPDQQKDNDEDKYKRQRQWQIHLENTFKEQSLILLTFETFDQGDEKTWPDQQKDNDEDKHNDNDKDNDKYIKRAPSKSNIWDFWTLRHLSRVMRKHDLTNKKTTTKTNTKDKDNDKYI